LRIRFILMGLIGSMCGMGFGSDSFIGQENGFLYAVYVCFFFFCMSAQRILVPSYVKGVFGVNMAMGLFRIIWFGTCAGAIAGWGVGYVMDVNDQFVLNVYSGGNLAGFFVLLFADDEVDWMKYAR
jgi:hypothetical protein